MKKKIAAILVILLALGLATTACPNEAPAPTEAPAPEVGKRAPDFELDTLDRQTVILSQLKGTPVLVNFWTTWCGPCAYEMPYLQQINDEWPEETLVVLTVNIQESSSQVSQFMQSQELSFTVLLDSNGNVAHKYNVMGFPTTFFIDSGGVIQEIKIGAFRSKADIEAVLSQLN